MTALDARVAAATQLAREGGLLAQRMRASLGPIEVKSRIDFCTEADHAVERLIRTQLQARFGDAMLGEEEGIGEADGGAGGDSLWVVDPIDGTANYIHGTTRWCISIAYMRDGVTEIGAIYAPDDDRLFLARRGGGASLNGQKIRVSHLAHGAAPVVELGWSERRPLTAFCALLQRLDSSGLEFRRQGSGALGLVDVACGRSDAYAELHINAWDALAGLLLVEEAGGRTSPFLRADGLARGAPLLAATPEAYDRIAPMLPELMP